MKSYFESIHIILKYAKVEALGVIITSVLSGIILPFQTFILKCIIDSVIDKENSYSFVIFLSVYILISVLFLLQSYTQDASRMLLQKKLTENFEIDILDHLNKLSYPCFENKETHDLINRFSAPAALATDSFFCLLAIPQTVLTLLGFAILFLRASPIFLFIIFLLFFISLHFNMKEINRLRKLQVEQSINERKTEYVSNLFTNRIAAKEINLFNLKNHLLHLFKHNTMKMIDERNEIRREGFKGGVISQIINMLFITIGVFALILFVIYNNMAISQCISLSTSLPTLGIIASYNLPHGIVSLRQKMYVWKDFDSLMKLPLSTMAVSDTLPNEPTISFKNVWFAYPGTEREVLKGVSFTICPGEKVAIVGENGCGKSTIIKLMLGLYTNYRGKIHIGDISINALSDSAKKDLFASIFQDVNIYQLSIKENIILADKEEFAEDRINEYANEAGFLNFINSMPGLYDTNIGKLAPDGIELSGGQRQRIALARVIHSLSKYAVLDEPTSAMDPKAEAEFYEELIPLFKNRSVIIVSHRLATAKMADKILVIKNGRVIETGSHEDLMRKNGYYYQMFTSQANWYIRNEDEVENEKKK